MTGRIDHLALDSVQRRLFVAALGNDSVEGVDLAGNVHAGRIAGLPEPQGALYLPEPSMLYVTLGEAASIVILNGRDLTEAGRIPTREDPDNIRREPGTDHLWVGAGRGSRGALSAFDASGAPLSEIPLDGHPESFQLEAGGPRIFVNVPAEAEVEVVDRQTRSVMARWKLPCGANFPMALDADGGRLFVVCRRPPRILAIDTETGRVVAQADAPDDADDVFLDPATRRIYVSAGEGIVRGYVRRERDGLERLGDVPTRSGARTSLFDPGSHRLFVAVPRRGEAPAEIQVFDTAE